MLEFDFQSIEQTQRVEFAKMARRLPGNRASVEFIVKHIGVRVTTTRNDSYFVDAFNYLCAHLFARANMPNEAAEAIAASKVLPYSGGDVLFHDAVADSIALAHAQDEAIKRGALAITLASMPRAASAALTQTLARITGAPIFRVSIGEFPNYWLMPAWLKRLTPGGAILHDHFGASKFNLLELHSHGIKSVFVRNAVCKTTWPQHWPCLGFPFSRSVSHSVLWRTKVGTSGVQRRPFGIRCIFRSHSIRAWPPGFHCFQKARHGLLGARRL